MRWHSLAADVAVRPDFNGLPPAVETGLVRLADNAAAILVLASGLGIAISLLTLLFARWSGNHQLDERAKGGLLLSVGAVALLYLAVAAANYATHLFQ